MFHLPQVYPRDPDSSAGQGHRHIERDLLEAVDIPPNTPVTATARPIRLSGVSGVFGYLVNGLYTPSKSQHCSMPIYRKLMSPPSSKEQAREHKAPADMFLVFHDSYKPRSKAGVSHAAWLVQTREGKVYARAVLPLRAPPCYPQELYKSPDGKYRREDVAWEMRSSVKVFGFRVRPAGAVHVVDDGECAAEMGGTGALPLGEPAIGLGTADVVSGWRDIYTMVW